MFDSSCLGWDVLVPSKCLEAASCPELNVTQSSHIPGHCRRFKLLFSSLFNGEFFLLHLPV